MPLYDYICEACGPFRDWASLANAEALVPCPVCGASAGRSIAMPFLAIMNPNARTAHARNERSAHEPRVMSRQELAASGRKRSEVFGDNRHRLNQQGCAHGHHHEAPGRKGRFQRAHSSSRPWMMGH